MSPGYTLKVVRRVLVAVLDALPAWIWKPANVRWLGSRVVHFCYDGSGHRTVEVDGKTILTGRRHRRPASDGVTGRHAD
jgi:hypothetical protein